MDSYIQQQPPQSVAQSSNSATTLTNSPQSSQQNLHVLKHHQQNGQQPQARPSLDYTSYQQEQHISNSYSQYNSGPSMDEQQQSRGGAMHYYNAGKPERKLQRLLEANRRLELDVQRDRVKVSEAATR
jgi:hypothetical protein